MTDKTDTWDDTKSGIISSIGSLKEQGSGNQDVLEIMLDLLQNDIVRPLSMDEYMHKGLKDEKEY